MLARTPPKPRLGRVHYICLARKLPYEQGQGANAAQTEEGIGRKSAQPADGAFSPGQMALATWDASLALLFAPRLRGRFLHCLPGFEENFAEMLVKTRI